MEAKRIIRILCLGFALCPGLALAGAPRCYLHGIIIPENGEKKSMSDMIRMHFDANNKAKCELMLKSYCDNHIYRKDYSPVRLKASFKADVDKPAETAYTFNRKCKLLNEDEE